MKTVTYTEYYPHYTGTYCATFTMSWDEFVSLTKVNFNDVDNIDKLSNIASERAGRVAYAIIDLVINNNIVDIKNVLEDRGTWAGTWEEGSYAVSVFGKDACVAAIARIEAEYEKERIISDMCGDTLDFGVAF